MIQSNDKKYHTYKEIIEPLYRNLRILRGRKRAKTSEKMMDILGYLPTKTNVRFRKAAKVILREMDIPLVSCSSGFFIAITPNQVKEYIKDLQKRINGMLLDIEACERILIMKRWDRITDKRITHGKRKKKKQGRKKRD